MILETLSVCQVVGIEKRAQSLCWQQGLNASRLKVRKSSKAQKYAL